MKTTAISRNLTAKIACMFMLLLMSLPLGGCALDYVNTDSDIYQNIQDQTRSFAEDRDKQRVNGVDWMVEKVYAIARKPYKFWIVAVACECIGIVALKLVTNDQAIRQRIVLTFMLGIPALCILLSFVLPYMVGRFL